MKSILNVENYCIKYFVTDNNSKILFSGSGFLINSLEFCYLVTTRHNVFNDNGSFIGPKFSIFQFDNYPMELQLIYDFEELKRTGKISENIEKDIVALQIGIYDNNSGKIKYIDEREFPINTFSIENIIELSLIQIFSEIFMSGYPFSLIEENQYLIMRPITRKGIVSNIDLNNKFILSDLLSIQGDSGSPVFKISDDKIFLIGILKNTLNRPGGLGFSLIISIDVVKELIINN